MPDRRIFTKTDYGRTCESEAYTTDDKVWLWASNDRPVPLDAAREYGIPVDEAAQRAANDSYLANVVAAYRANYKGPSAEERAEARAAHGPGVKLVNILTGHEWTT